jgi:hypothetical protein
MGPEWLVTVSVCRIRMLPPDHASLEDDFEFLFNDLDDLMWVERLKFSRKCTRYRVLT